MRATFSGLLATMLACAISSAGQVSADQSELAAKTHMDQITHAQLDLGVRLVRGRADDVNPVISPLSIHAALTMARLGSKGETARELDSVLFPPSIAGGFSDALVSQYGSIDRLISAKRTDLITSTAQSLWINEKGDLESSYQKRVAEIFSAVAEKINFSESEVARKRINSWVSERTADRIPELIPAGMIRADLMAVLISALYFKAAWADPFLSPPQKAPFWVADGRTVDVEILRGTKSVGYFEDDRWQGVSLDYVGREFALIALVPKQKVQARDLARQLEVETLKSAVQGLTPERVEISMPKFELRYRCDLVDNLRQLGVSEPFSSGADFSAMSKLPISISAVLHESFIRVDEKGTEAAAATAVMMTRSAAFLEQPKVVNIDRPFVIILIEKGSRVPLFLGVIGEPKL